MSNPEIFFLLFHHDDGQWCAVPPGFENPLRHPMGRGPTRREAVHQLLAHPEFIHRAKLGEWAPEPRLTDFIEVRPPQWAGSTSVDFAPEGFESRPPLSPEESYRFAEGDYDFDFGSLSGRT